MSLLPMKVISGGHIADEDLCNEVLINPKLNRTNQYICDCPFCGKESHFYIDKTTQLWDCKKCGESGNIYKLLRYVDKLYLLQGATVEERETIESVRSVLATMVDSEEEEIIASLPVIPMPAGWHVLENGNSYLRGRGVSAEECVRYELGETRLFRKYKNYLLVPIRDDGKIRGFIGRYASKHVPDGVLRYNNSVGTEFAQLLFGYDEIVAGKTTTVILVEGIFDKMSVDRFLGLWDSPEVKCVSTFGKKISDAQIAKLISKQVRRVILLYDFDAVKDIKRYGLVLEKFFVTDITFTSKSKDIDECSPSEAAEVFSNFYKPRQFAEDVIGKLKR